MNGTVQCIGDIKTEVTWFVFRGGALIMDDGWLVLIFRRR